MPVPGLLFVTPGRYLVDMNTTTPIDPFAAAEQALAAAGIDFTVVDHCPAPDCAACLDRIGLAPAA